MSQDVAQLAQKFNYPFIPSSSKSLNNLLTPEGASLHAVSRGITLFYGPGGSGKTRICLNLAFNANQLGLKTVYLDTEGTLDVYSIIQVMKAFQVKTKPIVHENQIKIENILFVRKATLTEINEFAPKIQQRLDKNQLDFIIVDSLTRDYVRRACMDEGVYGKVSKDLHQISSRFTTWTMHYPLAIVYTAQPISDVAIAEIQKLEEGLKRKLYDKRYFVGGKSLEHDPKCRCRLERVGFNRTQVTLEKHRSKPVGKTCTIKLCDKGICDI